jgi:hypothetical protein
MRPTNEDTVAKNEGNNTPNNITNTNNTIIIRPLKIYNNAHLEKINCFTDL